MKEFIKLLIPFLYSFLCLMMIAYYIFIKQEATPHDIQLTIMWCSFHIINEIKSYIKRLIDKEE